MVSSSLSWSGVCPCVCSSGGFIVSTVKMIKTLRFMPSAGCPCGKSSQGKLKNLKSKTNNSCTILDFANQAAAERDLDIKLLNNNTTTKKSAVKKSAVTAWLKSTTSSNNTTSSSSNSNPTTMDLLQLLAINALEFTAPASAAFFLQPPSSTNSSSTSGSSTNSNGDSKLEETKHPIRSFVQLSGHPGSFAPAGPHTIWKKQTDDSHETNVYEYLSNSDDSMKYVIPTFMSRTEWNDETFIELEDLLTGFDLDAAVMDLKIGKRTFLESEVTNVSERSDLYQKMVKVDPQAPSEEEHKKKAVTKLRYMQFREEQSSTSSLGFRIEAIKFQNEKEPMSDLKTMKTETEVTSMMKQFLPKSKLQRSQLVHRLKEIRKHLESSEFFMTHEVIGSSVLLIHDSKKVGAWLIDFAKTVKSPVGRLNHRVPWKMGNHEDGWMNGLDNLIKIIDSVS